jgi:hypothetical protein
MTARWTAAILAFGLVLAACQPVPASSDVFAPAREKKAPAPRPPEGGTPTDAAPAEAAATAGGFDFEGEDRPDDEAKPPKDAAPLTPAEMFQGLGLGDAPPQVEKPAEPAPAAAPAPAAPQWTGSAPPVSWGVRLVSTVPDAQPPRAILGMADGKEAVVTPGTLLPDARIVVLAVGRDVVQVAEVTPEGDHARVATYLLQALYPGQQQPR